MIGFASQAYSKCPNRIGFEAACENPPPRENDFEVEIKFQEVEIKFQEIEKYEIRTNQRLRCVMRVEKNIRLRLGYDCCCCCCCSAAAAALPLLLGVLSMLYGSHAKAVNKRHRGAMCSVCVGRAVRCACVAPKPKAQRQFFSLTGRICSRKRTAHRAPESACCSSRQSTRRCHRFCICTLSTLRCMTLPAFTAASMAVNRSHRGAMDSVCVGRAVRCRDMRVSPQSPQHDDDFFR